jgi:hypothetical protein
MFVCFTFVSSVKIDLLEATCSVILKNQYYTATGINDAGKITESPQS